MRTLIQKIQRSWFDLPLRSKGVIVIAIPVVCILFSVVALYFFEVQRQRLAASVVRAFQVGTRLLAVDTLIKDAESGIRGFLLTQDDNHLKPLRQAERLLPQNFERLREALADNSSLIERLSRVESLCNRRMASLAVTLSSSPTKLPGRLSQNEALSSSITQELKALREAESRLFLGQATAEHILRRRLSVAMYSIAILSLLAGCLAMGLFVSGIVLRLQLLRDNAGRLASREPLLPASGSDEIGQLGVALKRSSDLLSQRETELRTLNQELDLRVRERTVQLEQETADRQRSDEQLRQAQKMEAIGRLAGGVAHDFNNVLTILFGYGQLLHDKIEADSSACSDLDQILRSGEHAASLTRQLLAFSRRKIMQPQIVDLNSVVTRTGKLLLHLIGEDVDFQTITSPDLNKVLADEGQIEQVLVNLAVNARDAMPKGGKLTIRTDNVELDEEYCRLHMQVSPGRYVMIAVTDSGHGMTDEVKSRLFEPFFTTKEQGKGTGLGLATVYGIVKQSGGSIWIYSEVGLGTTFKVYLPAVVNAQEQPHEAYTTGPRVNGSATILLVEDEPVVRQMTRQVLDRCGYKVLEADGADAARSICRNHLSGIDLMLTDVVMPKVNGRELAGELQSQYPDMKVVYMSGYTDDVILPYGIRSGEIAFIEKPFTPKTLSLKLQEVLNGSAIL